MLSALYAVCLSVRPFVCHTGGSLKNGEVRIMLFSPSSPIHLVLRDRFHQEILMGSPERERETRVGWGKHATFVLQKSKMAADCHLGYKKIATGLTSLLYVTSCLAYARDDDRHRYVGVLMLHYQVVSNSPGGATSYSKIRNSLYYRHVRYTLALTCAKKSYNYFLVVFFRYSGNV